MANGNGNGKRFLDSNPWVLLLAMAASGGTGALWNHYDPNARSDPFTGTQAREMEARIREEIKRVREEDKQLQLRHDREIDAAFEAIRRHNDHSDKDHSEYEKDLAELKSLHRNGHDGRTK